MNDKEIKLLVNELKKFRKKLAASEEESRHFLINAGIITQKGNLKANYKHLCIPQEQD